MASFNAIRSVRNGGRDDPFVDFITQGRSIEELKSYSLASGKEGSKGMGAINCFKFLEQAHLVNLLRACEKTIILHGESLSEIQKIYLKINVGQIFGDMFRIDYSVESKANKTAEKIYSSIHLALGEKEFVS